MKGKTSLTRKHLRIAILTLAVTILGVVASIYSSIFQNSNDHFSSSQEVKKKVLFLGSGSVIKYLKGIKNKSIDSTAYYFDGPSKTAFEFLTSSTATYAFLPNIELVSMSSTQFTDSIIDPNLSNKIVEIQLPVDDSLKAIFYNFEPDALPQSPTSSKIIDDSHLLQIIQRNKYLIYITVTNSGHWINFSNLFKSCNPDFHWPNSEGLLKTFDLDQPTIDSIRASTKPLIILCSKYFKPENIGVEYDVESTRSRKTYPLYLYFQVGNNHYSFNSSDFEITNNFQDYYIVLRLLENIYPNYKLIDNNSSTKSKIINLILKKRTDLISY